ncbi:MAG: (deoxy)nucleoside triphosphate pyrophosphohydrolase [Candidatus Hydrogenedentes bacterium]|nr:(deoxy)nucleoside triphosphate pyrophosphohydrolase [Candidatus Hydrogenedentota bacterium]
MSDKKLVLVVACALIDADNRILLAQRPKGKSMAGLWEFPGGKLESGETHQEALVRECAEELSITVKVGGMISTVKHAYTHLKVTLNVYRCTIISGKERPNVHTELKWIKPTEFDDYAFPKGNHKFLDLLRPDLEFGL